MNSVEGITAELRQLRETVYGLEQKIEALVKDQTRNERLTEHPHIYSSPDMHSGEPTIRGTAVTVRTIVESSRFGYSIEEILQAYPSLAPAQVYDALAYYYDHPDQSRITSARTRRRCGG